MTGLRKGRYCLVTRADPKNRLAEIATGGEDNNVQTAAIRFSPERASRRGHEVAVLDEPCAPPTP